MEERVKLMNPAIASTTSDDDDDDIDGAGGKREECASRVGIMALSLGRIIRHVVRRQCDV